MVNNRTLGIDLGSNSLGWAILDDISGDIIDKGVVTFPDGILNPTNDNLETPAAVRRAARMGRRMKFRRKLRKWHLLKLLIDNGMCPMTPNELEAWRSKGIYPVSNGAFIEWLKSTDVSNPYLDRKLAAEGVVAPFVLGRALYHIAQRRGFKSSRKDADDANDKKSEVGKVKGGISELSREIAESGCETLGQYFYKIYEENKDLPAKTRIRTRYTSRANHYEVEFNAIMEAQGYARDDELRAKLHNAIFMQRPLRSQKHLVGRCPLEKSCSRAQICHPLFEEFSARAFINNLRFVLPTPMPNKYGIMSDRVELTRADKDSIYSVFEKHLAPFKFKAISDAFKNDIRFRQGYRFHYYGDSDVVQTMATHNRIRDAFDDVAYDEQKVFDALSFFDDDEKLRAWFKKCYPDLNDAAVDKLVKIRLREGYAKYSLKAIKKILPFLREWYPLDEARFFAKLPDVVDDFDARRDEVLSTLRTEQANFAKDKAERDNSGHKAPIKPLTERYRESLRDKWNVTEKEFETLYLNSDDTYQVDFDDAYPHLPAVELGMIRNPLVQRSMTSLRRLVNHLRGKGKIDADTTIRIELARNVNDYAHRKALQAWQKERAEKRAKYINEIEALGVAPSEDAIIRYTLWEEQGRKCLYTGRNIKPCALYTVDWDIEHTIPRSRSGDDSLANKTLCDAEYNRKTKRGLIPTECPNYDGAPDNAPYISNAIKKWQADVERLEANYKSQCDATRRQTLPDKRSQARIKALTTKLELDYWRDKVRRFTITAEELARGGDKFMNRQLVDTGVMTKHAVSLLKSRYRNVYTVNGNATAFARKAWGIQDDGAKDRTSHTHHAKDAMVVAALTTSRFNAICTALKGEISAITRECDICPEPFSGKKGDFARKVRAATEEILVKNVLRQTTLRQSSKKNVLAKAHPLKSDPTKTVRAVLSKGDTVRGQLHKDTFYGCIIPSSGEKTGKECYVVRKSLVGKIKEAKTLIDKIVDDGIRECVKRGIDKLEAEGKSDIAAGDITMPSGVPINKVRIFANTSEPHKLREHAFASKHKHKRNCYVTSAEGSNFRLGLFKNKKGKFDTIPDNSLVWAKEHKQEGYLPLDKREGFIGYIIPGKMALAHSGDRNELKALSKDELCKRLYKIVKFRNDGLVTMRLHTEARAAKDLEADLAKRGKHAKGESTVNLDEPHELLLISPGKYTAQMVFEGIDFTMELDGTIKFNW